MPSCGSQKLGFRLCGGADATGISRPNRSKVQEEDGADCSVSLMTVSHLLLVTGMSQHKQPHAAAENFLNTVIPAGLLQASSLFFCQYTSSYDLIHTVHDRQLRFLGHMLQNTHSPLASTYALYQPTHGTTRRGHPRLNCMDYIEKLTGMKVNELLEVSQDREAWRELVVACVDLQPPD